MKLLKVKKLDPKAILPTRAYDTDCGLDIYSLESATISPGQGHVFHTGIAADFPPGYLGMIVDRSSMSKKGYKIGGGIIDPFFSGELSVNLRNVSNETLSVAAGDRIAQLLLLPIFTPEVIEVTTLTKGPRSTNGYGSSGR